MLAANAVFLKSVTWTLDIMNAYTILFAEILHFFIHHKLMVKLVTFIKEVKAEAKKITWPDSKELTMTAIFVVCVAFISGLSFFLIDSLVYKLIKTFLNFGG